MMERVLEVSSVSKRFENYQAVKNASFALESGECVALLGPNGAGKTTILKMIVDMINPDQGKIDICGQKNIQMKQKIGYLPQYPNFYGWMTGIDALHFMGKLSGMDKVSLEARIPEVLEQVGLNPKSKKKIATYSGGMRQRLGIAQAILHRPAVLIMDEPVSALDPIGRREVIELIQSLKAETTLLFSTHILADVEEICERVCIIREGEIVADDKIANLVQINAEQVFILKAEGDISSFESQLAGNAEIREIAQKNGAIHVYYNNDAATAREAIMQALLASRLHWTSVSQAEESLEEVFLRMVSK
ncbi:ABC transporter ATP-binding protein [Listeria booriae]|uniref:ABC transporter ATP-binding protein n=1 Tax=Listeria booriae TaxID=1552123 RepID=UPI0021AB425C|nr:ABC transporter ATP-binding protein [Listeria booriae]